MDWEFLNATLKEKKIKRTNIIGSQIYFICLGWKQIAFDECFLTCFKMYSGKLPVHSIRNKISSKCVRYASLQLYIWIFTTSFWIILPHSLNIKKNYFLNISNVIFFYEKLDYLVKMSSLWPLLRQINYTAIKSATLYVLLDISVYTSFLS